MKALRLLCFAAALPAAAQGFLDDPAFGGSRVFSEGYGPLGNPARFDRCPAGWYFGVQDGDLKARNQAAFTAPLDLDALAKAPWATRSFGFGLTLTQAGLHGSVSRERWNGLDAAVDRDPAHLGANLGLNTTAAQLLRAEVERVVVGAGSSEGRSGYGFAVRVERWRIGRAVAALNPQPGQLALLGGPHPLDAAPDLAASLDVNLNGGYVIELGRGIRFGLMGDHLLPRTLAGLSHKAQFRAGFQVDAGPSASVSVEADLNEATRLPLVAPQKSFSASVRLGFGPAVGLTFGAERRTVGGVATTAAGATLYWKLPALSVGFGLRIADEVPMKTLLVRVDA
jgi:hypothetical protein